MAKRLSSTGWLVKETIKRLPEATVKVGKAVVGGIKKVGKALVDPMMKYDNRMQERSKATPQGRKLLESIKKEGFRKTLKKSKTGEFD